MHIRKHAEKQKARKVFTPRNQYIFIKAQTQFARGGFALLVSNTHLFSVTWALEVLRGACSDLIDLEREHAHHLPSTDHTAASWCWRR